MTFDDDRDLSLDVRDVGQLESNGSIVSTLTFCARTGQRRAASLVRPAGVGPFPVVLYVHWYEPEACDSNRTQFLEEATTLAGEGAMSLLIETMWSDREWFLKRTQADDWADSVHQTVELRRAMDLLLSQAGADPARFAYVGHDFGAMYGVVAGSVDARPTCYVFMAGTPRFPDWYLYYPRLKEEARDAYVKQMRPLDPIGRVKELAPAPLFFQFGTQDPHVPVDRGQAFFDAACEPKAVNWYDVGHGLNDAARRDRLTWLRQQLGL